MPPTEIPGLKRFCREALLESGLQRRLLQAAADACPGQAARGGLLTKEQRTWVNNLLGRKLWQHVREEHKTVLADSNARTPELAYLLPHLESLLAAQVPAVVPKAAAVVATSSTPSQSSRAARGSADGGQTAASKRKPKAAAFTDFSKRHQRQVLSNLMGIMGPCCPSKADAVAVLSGLLQKVEELHPGASQEVQASMVSDCYCEPLVSELASMRKEWKNHSMPVARALDRAIERSGFKAERLVSLNYFQDKQHAAAALKRRVQKWHMKSKGGRPSKVKSAFWQSAVKEVLDNFSTPSSITCLVPGTRERRLVRNLCGTPTMVWRSSPSLRGLDFKQFSVIRRKYFPEYKKGRRLTDLCDHCAVYDRKIRPRTREFLVRAQRELEERELWDLTVSRSGFEGGWLQGYWAPVLKISKYSGLLERDDLCSALEHFVEIVGSVHERRCQTVRQQAPHPQLINHVEGSLRKEAMLHAEIVNAYTWHLAAAQMEQRQMRQLAAELPKNCAYAHCDYMEKLPIPISNRETSDMFHGSTRKTISVFGMYLVECDAEGTRQTTAIILLSDVIELSAMFGNLCIKRALRHVKRMGSLDCLYLGFDAGNHFRSYENLHEFLYRIPAETGQTCRVNYLVEKHGKSMDDAEIFSPVRRWLDEFLLVDGAFADSEHAIQKILDKAAKREWKQNPVGTKFIVEVFEPGQKPNKSLELVFDDDADNHITRTYSWLSKPTGNARYPVAIQNCLFSSAAAGRRATFSIAEKLVPADRRDWKRGYWGESATWRRGPIQPGQVNEVIRKYREQLSVWRQPLPRARRATVFEELAARDEQRLQKVQSRQRKKREAALAGQEPSDSETSL
ncbi:Cacna1g [Symbiodinium sp. CCMP2592]|nr:Cacna1g [Symbiodinium sp. CCMP2592]